MTRSIYLRWPPWALVLMALVLAGVVQVFSDQRGVVAFAVQFPILLGLIFGLRALLRWDERRRRGGGS